MQTRKKAVIFQTDCANHSINRQNAAYNFEPTFRTIESETQIKI